MARRSHRRASPASRSCPVRRRETCPAGRASCCGSSLPIRWSWYQKKAARAPAGRRRPAGSRTSAGLPRGDEIPGRLPVGRGRVVVPVQVHGERAGLRGQPVDEGDLRVLGPARSHDGRTRVGVAVGPHRRQRPGREDPDSDLLDRDPHLRGCADGSGDASAAGRTSGACGVTVPSPPSTTRTPRICGCSLQKNA